MSHVTDLVLVTGIHDDDIRSINSYLFNNCNQQVLKILTPVFGGVKYPQLHCFGGAINYLGSIEPLIKIIKEHKWDEPESVKLIYQEDCIEIFELIPTGLDKFELQDIKNYVAQKYSLFMKGADSEDWLDEWLQKLENRMLLEISLQKIGLTLAPIPRYEK